MSLQALLAIPTLRSLIEINVPDRLIDQFSERDQRIACPQGRSTGKIAAGGRQASYRGRLDALAAMTGAHLSDAATVYAEVCSDVMLAVTACNHPLHDGNLVVVRRHGTVSYPRLNNRVENTRTPAAVQCGALA